MDSKLVACLDVETCNVSVDGEPRAYPVAYTFAVLREGAELRRMTPENVEELAEVRILRHAADAYELLDDLTAEGETHDYIPVVAVHNLGFDMHALSPWILRHGAGVVARSEESPVAITVNGADGAPKAVLWDTLGMFAKSLETMGAECGFRKLSGSWDYTKRRTPETPLSDDETAYVRRDVLVMLAYIGRYLRLNPRIPPDALGRKVLTKTGAVRYKRESMFSRLKPVGGAKSAGRMWAAHTQRQRPGDNDELWTMQACTRGGLAFASERWAGVPLVCDEQHAVIAYDAASQHPAQMASHLFPQHFQRADPGVLAVDMELVANVTLGQLLGRLDKPFPVAFDACIDVTRLRLKKGSVFEREAIATLSSSRRGWPGREREGKKDYKDSWGRSRESFGSVKEADYARLYVTELEWWIINQVYDYDTAIPVHGYETGRFCPATDLCMLGVMHYYNGKRELKSYINGGDATEFVRSNVPLDVMDGFRRGDIQSIDELQQIYAVIKSELNSLYGIEVTNEARPDQRIERRAGICRDPETGIDDMPKFSKAWYQFGQRVAGWSRIAQVVTILLVAEQCEGIICGDTDSIKMLARKSKKNDIDNALNAYHLALDKAKKSTCKRVERGYPAFFDALEGIGHYELEFMASRFFLAWTKAYMHDASGNAKITLAGIPTGKGEHSLNKLANELLDVLEWDEVCEQLLGYNVTLGSGITELNGRATPEFGAWFDGEVDGDAVSEPSAVAIFPEPKTIGGTLEPENARNSVISLRNNPNVSIEPTLIDWHGEYMIERILQNG